jgi:hypothetical protein
MGRASDARRNTATRGTTASAYREWGVSSGMATPSSSKSGLVADVMIIVGSLYDDHYLNGSLLRKRRALVDDPQNPGRMASQADPPISPSSPSSSSSSSSSSSPPFRPILLTMPLAWQPGAQVRALHVLPVQPLQGAHLSGGGGGLLRWRSHPPHARQAREAIRAVRVSKLLTRGSLHPTTLGAPHENGGGNLIRAYHDTWRCTQEWERMTGATNSHWSSSVLYWRIPVMWRRMGASRGRTATHAAPSRCYVVTNLICYMGSSPCRTSGRWAHL